MTQTLGKTIINQSTNHFLYLGKFSKGYKIWLSQVIRKHSCLKGLCNQVKPLLPLVREESPRHLLSGLHALIPWDSCPEVRRLIAALLGSCQMSTGHYSSCEHFNISLVLRVPSTSVSNKAMLIPWVSGNDEGLQRRAALQGRT